MAPRSYRQATERPQNFIQITTDLVEIISDQIVDPLYNII